VGVVSQRYIERILTADQADEDEQIAGADTITGDPRRILEVKAVRLDLAGRTSSWAWIMVSSDLAQAPKRKAPLSAWHHPLQRPTRLRRGVGSTTRQAGAAKQDPRAAAST
jgi:hypothetical protein